MMRYPDENQKRLPVERFSKPNHYAFKPWRPAPQKGGRGHAREITPSEEDP